MFALPAGRFMACLAAVAALALALPVSAAPVNLAINGYVQARYSNVLDLGTTPDTFEANRAYINLKATVDEHVSATILINAIGKNDTTTTILAAYGEYTDKPYTARLGLASIPFGYEAPLGSSGLITLERSQVIQKEVYPDAFDHGVFGYYLPAQGANIALALVNGEASNVNKDTNDTKNVVGRAGFCFDNGQIGLSLYDGNGPAPSNDAKDRLGVDLRYIKGPLTVYSEYVSGTSGARDFDGGYVTAAYMTGKNLQPYLRLDTYDPSNATGDTYNRATVGANYFPNPKTRATVEYQVIDDDTAKPEGFIGAQYQVGF